MIWSRYNKLFKSKKYGWLLYNSASNSFLEISDDTYEEILKIKNSPDLSIEKIDAGLYFQLLTNGILVEEYGDETFRNVLKLKRLQNLFTDKNLSLTIAPTRNCNFSCVYCYEKDRNPIFMTDATEKNLISFVNQFKNLNNLRLVWYGGEPLLAFDRICSLTTEFKQLKIPFKAILVTNGYLLDEDKIKKLNDLEINRIQITLDGPEEVHNSRRPLNNGGKTFKTIMANIENLLSNWSGSLSIRVNVDFSNKKLYHQIHDYIVKKLKLIKSKARYSIYPGIINNCNQLHPDTSCIFDKDDEAKFTIEQFKEHGIKDFRLFPQHSYGGCDAALRQGYIVGPEGELYKCWHDMGREDRIIGKLGDDSVGDLGIVANYMVGFSNLNDPECSDCFYFPICDGGCPNVRFNDQFDLKKKGSKHCYKFKNYIEDILEMHYMQKKEEKNYELEPRRNS